MNMQNKHILHLPGLTDICMSLWCALLSYAYQSNTLPAGLGRKESPCTYTIYTVYSDLVIRENRNLTCDSDCVVGVCSHNISYDWRIVITALHGCVLTLSVCGGGDCGGGVVVGWARTNWIVQLAV